MPPARPPPAPPTCPGAKHGAAQQTAVLQAEQLPASPAFRATGPVLLATGSSHILQVPSFGQATSEVHQGVCHLPRPQLFIGAMDPRETARRCEAWHWALSPPVPPWSASGPPRSPLCPPRPVPTTSRHKLASGKKAHNGHQQEGAQWP